MTKSISKRVLLCFLFVAFSAASAWGAPLFDDTYLAVDLKNDVRRNSADKPSNVTYHFEIKSRVFDVKNGDMLRVQWVQNGNKLADVKVPFKVINGVGTTAWSDNSWNRQKLKLQAHGPMTAKLSVKSPTGQETPLRDLSFEVERMWHVDSTHPKVLHSPRYKVLPKDNLGLNWIWLRDPSSTEPRGRVYFYFWAPVDGDNNEFYNAYLHITRNGQEVPVPQSRNGNNESITEVNCRDDRNENGQRLTRDRSWNLIWVKPQLVWGGRNGAASSLVSNTLYNISENPGKYVVRLLSNGDLVREWKFEIAADGSFVKHPAQASFSMRPGAYFLEATYPSENDSQFYFDPAVVKKSAAYGRSWQNQASLAEFFSRLPGKRGAAAFPTP